MPDGPPFIAHMAGHSCHCRHSPWPDPSVSIFQHSMQTWHIIAATATLQPPACKQFNVACSLFQDKVGEGIRISNIGFPEDWYYSRHGDTKGLCAFCNGAKNFKSIHTKEAVIYSKENNSRPISP